MSNILYPLGLIAGLQVERFDRVLADAFDDGSTSARSPWPAQYFKRRFQLQHAPLTETEWRYLRSFHSQRSGRYDSFWFRDNAHRDGNAAVRFAQPLQIAFSGGVINPAVQLEEIAAIRALPELDELTAAAGTAPLAWFDANRERYLLNANTIATEAAAFDNTLTGNATWQAGTLPLGDILAQYQHYAFAGSQWAKTPATVPIGTGNVALTLFVIAKHAAAAAKTVLFAVGTMSADAAAGIALAADNYYEPWQNGAAPWSSARSLNTPASTWRSLAVVFSTTPQYQTLYVNAASIGYDGLAPSFLPGPLTLGAAIAGTLKTTGLIAHVLVIPAALSLAQIKAVHNLLGYQFSLATVA